MEWQTTLLLLGLLAVIGIFVTGGRAKVSRAGVEIDTPGFLRWLQKAREEKHVPPTTEKLQTVPLPPGRSNVKLPLASILWVDDHPVNNHYERRALASSGVFCDTYTTNTEALTAIRTGDFDLIVSDIGRGQNAETGWDLLADVRTEFRKIPFVFYTMGVSDELRREAIQAGVSGIAEEPDDLMNWVFRLLQT